MNRVELLEDWSGSGVRWAVMINGVQIWTHNAIEGPPPDAIILWNRLAQYLPVSRIEER